MARILVQTNDRRTVLDEGGVQAADIHDQSAAGSLLDRLERAVCDAESRRFSTNARVRRLAVIVPTSGYREVGG